MKESQIKDQDLNNLVSTLLRTGVILSIAIIGIGLILGFIRNDLSFMTHVDYNQIPNKNIFKDFFANLSALDSIAIVELGIFIMIITPILRLLLAGLGYFLEKDYLYTFISLLVLGIIIVSFFFGLKA